MAGQQYEYAFDDIGNRSSTKSGGDSVGASLRLANYTANALNQYTSRDVSAYLNVLGIAHANASVTVNGQSPYRRGEYYRSEINSDNSVNPVWQSVTNIASLSGTSQTNTGNLFLPKTAESYTFDADGNLTSDGRWTNKWDAENRLIDMTSHSSGPSGSRKSLQFAYDSQGRRYSKVVSNWTGSAWTRALHELYLYDGWNLLGALDGTNNAIVRSFLWGLDLSGSLQGAGGVGGLICFKLHSGSLSGSHFAAYDGNGNVMALVDGKTGSTSARYEYDPFGQTIRASGTMAMLNPVRFSSKPIDDETDLAYYGYRYLNPNTGRWLNRDPIEEAGGLSLYVCVDNRVVNTFDLFGARPPLISRRNDCFLRCGSWQPDPFGTSRLPDGCSAPPALVGDPNNPTGRCSFEEACNEHDRCYSDCSKTRAECDDAWHKEMRNRCRSCLNNIPMGDRPTFLGDCYLWADTFYGVVAALGGPAYNARQDAACHCAFSVRGGAR